MRRFLIVTNRTKDTDLSVTKKIENYLKERKAICDIYDAPEEIPKELIADDLDCAIVLGGDGTILHAITPLVYYNIPILGVNMGTVGFLASVELEDLEKALLALLEGRYEYDDRIMLEGTVYRNGKQIFKAAGVNDIAISRSGFSRIIRFCIWLNEELVDSYGADGVVIATPTGSTGYNLSAGGPVVSPCSDVLIITPISPHSLTSRSIVVSGNETIALQVERIGQNDMEAAFITIDGQHGTRLKEKDRIEIKRANVKTRLLKVDRTGFFEVLRSKMGGRKL